MAPHNLPPRYEYLGEAYSGGQADVYVCRDKYLERKVAIKFYLSSGDPGEFLQELALLKDAESQHIAQIYDLIFDSDSSRLPGLVQEYIAGKCLSELSDAGLTEEQYLKTLFQIASGVSDLHRQDIVHRDIKPHNMRFDAEGVVKLLDFGLSCILADEDLETLHGRGTFGFRSPEFYNPPPVTISKTMDIYAFSATAWFIAEGDLPKALKDIPPQSKTLAPSFEELHFALPADIVEILDRCLSVEPELRPSIEHVRGRLERRLLYGKHTAEMVSGGERYVLDEPDSKIRIKSGDNHQISILYDGLGFFVSEFKGAVYINNYPATVGQELPGSCVITLKPVEAGANRLFVPFNVSHPEVVL